MKALATVQFIIALIAALGFALPSIFFFGSPLGILGVLTVWGLGLYLISRYYKISSGAITERRSFGVWLLSFFFNLPGSLAALWYTADTFSTPDRGASWDRGDVLLSGLFFLPSVLGTILGIVGSARAKKFVDTDLEHQRVS